MPPSLAPSPRYARRYTVASRFWCQVCTCGDRFLLVKQSLTSSFQVTACDGTHGLIEFLQTIIFSSFPGRTPACRPSARNVPVVNGSSTPIRKNQAPSFHPHAAFA